MTLRTETPGPVNSVSGCALLRGVDMHFCTVQNGCCGLHAGGMRCRAVMLRCRLRRPPPPPAWRRPRFPPTAMPARLPAPLAQLSADARAPRRRIATGRRQQLRPGHRPLSGAGRQPAVGTRRAVSLDTQDPPAPIRPTPAWALIPDARRQQHRGQLGRLRISACPTVGICPSRRCQTFALVVAKSPRRHRPPPNRPLRRRADPASLVRLRPKP